jgi:Transposase DDE domain
MQQCLPWVQHLVNQLLAHEVASVASSRRIELLDASVLDGPQGHPWRLHLGYDPVNRCITQLRLTPQSTGETLHNFTPVAGTLYIADRGYGHLKTAKMFVAQGAHVLLRVKGSPWLAYADPNAIVAHEVEGGRIVIAPIPIDKRFKSQKKVVERVKRKGQRLSSTTQQVADYVFLFCSDATLPAQEAVALYRARWQIELVFKRLKSLQQLNGSRLKSETLFQVEAWGQLLVSLVIERMGREKASFFPLQAVAATVFLAILASPSGSDCTGSVSIMA